MLYRMGLCTKLCDQKWPKSKAFYLAFIFISNGPVSEKRDFLEKFLKKIKEKIWFRWSKERYFSKFGANRINSFGDIANLVFKNGLKFLFSRARSVHSFLHFLSVPRAEFVMLSGSLHTFKFISYNLILKLKPIL